MRTLWCRLTHFGLVYDVQESRDGLILRLWCRTCKRPLGTEYH